MEICETMINPDGSPNTAPHHKYRTLILVDNEFEKL